MKKTKFLKEKLVLIGAILLSVFLLFFVITSTWIGYEVKSQCRQAQEQYSGDCVEALSATLSDEAQSFRARNSAIWALGQLGDSRALPLLKAFYTGNIPNREPLDETISQYELKKAILLAEGGINITSFIWRSTLDK